MQFTCYNMVHKSAGNSLVHGGIFFRLDLDIEEFDQRFDSDSLDKNCPIDHGDCRRHKHVSMGKFFPVNEQDQGKGHCASQSAVHHHKLVHKGQFVKPILVGNPDQNEHPCLKKLHFEISDF